MAFVKLDCGMLDSTLWIDRAARELFITALLMAQPYELENTVTQIEVNSLALTDFNVPPGWYGFVPAAGAGIVRRSGMDNEQGMKALERLGEPDNESRTPRFDGRRMVRVEGGFIILNYDLYRQKDHTAAERARRYRERKSSASRVTLYKSRVTGRSVTQAEGEADNRSKGTEAQPPVPGSDFEAPTVEEAIRYAASAPVLISEDCAVAWHDDRSRAGWRYRKGDQMFPIRGEWEPDLRTFARSWESIRHERAAKNANGHAKPETKSRMPAEPADWRALFPQTSREMECPPGWSWEQLWLQDRETAREIVALSNQSK